jgi:hypothetical protein
MAENGEKKNDGKPATAAPQSASESALQSASPSESSLTSTPISSRRVMTPAIDDMSVREERQCLNEIREYGKDIPPNYILKNGWKAGHFALCYTLGHQRKRSLKGDKSGSGIDASGKVHK